MFTKELINFLFFKINFPQLATKLIAQLKIDKSQQPKINKKFLTPF